MRSVELIIVLLALMGAVYGLKMRNAAIDDDDFINGDDDSEEIYQAFLNDPDDDNGGAFNADDDDDQFNQDDDHQSVSEAPISTTCWVLFVMSVAVVLGMAAF